MHTVKAIVDILSSQCEIAPTIIWHLVQDQTPIQSANADVESGIPILAQEHAPVFTGVMGLKEKTKNLAANLSASHTTHTSAT